MADIEEIIIELSNLPQEAEWVEFKVNNTDPDEIGKNISALSNSAALLNKPFGYIVWGIKDDTHEIIGTDFSPRQKKIGNEELENWLLQALEPKINFIILESVFKTVKITIIKIPRAVNTPVRFKNNDYIRIGSYTKPLRKYPEKERTLWRIFDQLPFEKGVAEEFVSENNVLELINYPKYFSLMQQPLPENRQAILDKLLSENIILRAENGKYHITNVGAILFAKNLNDFSYLKRKSLRIIIYKGNSRVETIKEQIGSKGYAAGFEGAIRYINDQLPQNEQIGQAFRQEVRMYPEIAIRELVANALIHQDLNITGAGPMVEVFTDRMEISNPGVPLIDTLRFIDEPPKSRNETLASLMRRMAICEERGSGIDKVINSVEVFQLPAPDFRVAGLSTIAILFGYREFNQMNKEERIRACYQHACLLFVSGDKMSNASLRKRLGIKDKNYPQASRIIKDAIDKGLIRTNDEGGGSKRDTSYLPFWA